MIEAKEAIERGLLVFRELVAEDPVLEAELEASRARFGAGGGSSTSDQAMAARRHLEWFLLERPSEHLDGVPVAVLMGEWHGRAGSVERDFAEALLSSLAGAFEVTSTEAGRGVWVQDLFTLGELPIEEPEAVPELQTGDLLVGRLFPIGDGVFRMSPAVSCFRNPRLLEAVRSDLERMRETRRGVLRIQQLELERLFFGGTSAPASEAPVVGDREEAVDPALGREEVAAQLVEAGLTAAEAAEVVDAVVSAAGEPGVSTEILSQLAFETDVDLERARRALAELWASERAVSATSAQPGPAPAASAEPSTVEDAHAALEAFDRGRAEGRDLNELIAELSASLGVEPPEEEVDEPAIPDFPGVVGAMVEEFLWDVGRQRGASAAEPLGALRRLSDYAQNIGLFEDLGARELLDFAGRWLLDEGGLADGEEARRVFDALFVFCQWCEDVHAHPLWTDSKPFLEKLRDTVPRLILLRRHALPAAKDDLAFDVVDVVDDTVTLADPAGETRTAEIPSGVADLLRAGDVLRGHLVGEGAFHLSSAYPGELRTLLPTEG